MDQIYKILTGHLNKKTWSLLLDQLNLNLIIHLKRDFIKSLNLLIVSLFKAVFKTSKP